jgi:16S rRNA (cytosine967-C5)-methyltransferase
VLAPPDPDAVAACLVPRGHDVARLARAASSGRIRGIGGDLWARARSRPHAAGGLWRRGLREARALHSWERRLVADALRDLARLGPLLASAVGEHAVWDAWLATQGLVDGLSPTLVEAVTPEALASRLAERSPEAAWACLAGVPEPVAAELILVLGPEMGPFLAASARRAPIGIRATPGRRAEVVAALLAAGVEPADGTLVPEAVVVPAGADVEAVARRLPGALEVQDEASQLVASLVGAAPGLRVLDACAGAGGKALALAAAGADVLAADVRAPALDELAARAARHGVRIRTRTWRDGEPIDSRPFDVVLVDAPCSGSGTWRRHPELRWRLDALEATRAVQAEVLARASASVRPGGRLVYATCSVLPSEDEAIVGAFLASNQRFRAVAPTGAPPAVRSPDSVRSWPHRHGVDGFFAAVMEAEGR